MDPIVHSKDTVKGKVLVTGGGGFIASAVVRLLVERGYPVVVVDNFSAGSRSKVDPKAVIYEVDIRNYDDLNQVFIKERPDFVIHAAAQVQVVFSVKNPQADAQINIIGGINVLECCREHQVKKVVYLCTGGALYGDPVYLPADEEHPINPICPYGASKRALETYLYMYNLNFGMDFISVRFSNVYGPGDDLNSNRVVPNFVKAFFKGEQLFITGDGSQGRDFIYVDDVARAVVIALEKSPKDRFFNIGTQKVVSIKELFFSMKKIIGSSLEPVYVPARTGEVQQIYLANKRAREQLSWEPTVGIEEGLQKTIEWYRGLSA